MVKAHKYPCESNECYQFLCVDARLDKWKRELGPSTDKTGGIPIDATREVPIDATRPTFEKMVAMTTGDRKKNLIAAFDDLSHNGLPLGYEQKRVLAEYMEVSL